MPEIALSYQPRIVVCIPVYGWIPAETAGSITNMILNGSLNKLIVQFKMMAHTYVHEARNKLIEDAMKCDPTHILFLDADMTVPVDTCQRLLRHQKGVVSGLYFTRRRPYDPVYRMEKEWVEKPGAKFLSSTAPTGLTEVGYIGFGCVLVAASVIRRAVEVNKGPCRFFTFANDEGEDVNFCRLMHSLNEPIYLDPDCACGHVGTTVVSRETHVAQKNPSDSLG